MRFNGSIPDWIWFDFIYSWLKTSTRRRNYSAVADGNNPGADLGLAGHQRSAQFTDNDRGINCTFGDCRTFVVHDTANEVIGKSRWCVIDYH